MKPTATAFLAGLVLASLAWSVCVFALRAKCSKLQQQAATAYADARQIQATHKKKGPGKSGLAQVRKTADGTVIPSTALQAFIHNGPQYYMSDIEVYADGMIDCWELVDMEGFKEKVQEGWVVTSLPDGAIVHLGLVASVRTKNLGPRIPEQEFIKEVADTIEKLNHRPTSSERCLTAYEKFQKEKSEEARSALRSAYEAVPEHNRAYILGDMDLKDIPIRMIIYGEEEKENWSHRQVSRKLGLHPLPDIEVEGSLKKSSKEK